MITTTWETITPAQAAEMLKLNIQNRNVNRHHIGRLAGAMLKGEWEANGEAIKLTATRLLDGQHRLLACIMAQTPFRTLVVRGLEDGVMNTLDLGQKRKSADFFTLAGEKHVTLIVSSLGLVDRYLSGKLGQWVSYSPRSMEALLEAHPDIRECVNYMASRKVKFLEGSVACATLYLFTRRDRESAFNFLDKLITGVNLTPVDPAFVLRERLMRDMSTRSVQNRGKSVMHFAFTVKAWNATQKGDVIKLFKWSEGEEFPAIA